MLRLWPEPAARLTLYANAYRCAGEAELQAVRGDLLSEAFQYARERHPRARRILIGVANSHAAVMTLPWQSELTRHEERGAYAESLLRKVGIVPAKSWVTHADYREYQRQGLAYSFDLDFLDKLGVAASAAGFRIGRILPFAAIVYHQLSRARINTIWLWVDEDHVSALLQDPAGLIRTDVEPVAADAISASMRLIQRLQIEVGKCMVCSTGSSSVAGPALFEAIKERWPELLAQTLPLDFLERKL